MFKVFALYKQNVLLLFVIVLLSFIISSQGTSVDNLQNNDMSDSSNDEIQEQRQTYDLKKLRNFLLTSNPEERTAKRDKLNFHRRQLIREYLRSITDLDQTHSQDVKKRFCASLEEFQANRAVCFG